MTMENSYHIVPDRKTGLRKPTTLNTQVLKLQSMSWFCTGNKIKYKNSSRMLKSNQSKLQISHVSICPNMTKKLFNLHERF